MEVRLAQSPLELPQQRATFRVEVQRVLADRLWVGLLVHAVEPGEQAKRPGAPRLALDPRHRFEGGVGRESGRARQGAVEQEALDDSVRSHAARVTRLV